LSSRIEVLNEERPAPPADANTRDLALAMVQEMTSGTQGERATPWIAVTSGPDSGKALLLSDEDKPYVIGRGSSVDLSLKDERVSRRQISVLRRGRDVFVAGLAQNHRASLGDQALAETLELRWLPGTPLTIAQSVFVSSIRRTTYKKSSPQLLCAREQWRGKATTTDARHR
jgi:hypothetical protein